MNRTARNSIKLSFFTISSRVLGVIRDHYQAVFFGTGPVATAWEVAFMLPNMLRNLLAEGVLSQSFIPVYSQALKESKERGRIVAGRILVFLSMILLFITLLGIFLFPFILPVYTGRTKDESELLIYLSQVMFGFIATTSITAIFAGMSNTHQHFSIPALSPVILNLILISGYLILIPFHLTDVENAGWLAWGVIIGGIVQLAFQAWHVYHFGWWPDLKFDLKEPALKKIYTLMAPAVLGASLFQLNQLIDIALASYLIPESFNAVPALRYAHRLIQLPTGIIGVALSTAILPSLVASIRENRSSQNISELSGAVSLALFLTVPAALGLFILGPSIIDLIYSGGAWGSESTELTWLALKYYTLGVPFFSLNKILTSSFYAYEDTKTPVKILIRIVIINFLMNIVLVPYLYQGGLAVSTSVTALLNTLFLFYYLRKKLDGNPLTDLIRRILRQLPLWIMVAIYLFCADYFFAESIQMAGETFANMAGFAELARYRAFVYTGFVIITSFVLYLSVAIFIKLPELDVFRHVVNRKKPQEDKCP